INKRASAGNTQRPRRRWGGACRAIGFVYKEKHRLPCPNPAADAKVHNNIDPASLETLVQEKKDELFRLLLQMDLHNGSCEKSAEENKAILRLLRQFRAETRDNGTLSGADTKNLANRYVLPVSIILSGIIIVAQGHFISHL
ncbi:Os03g0839300, partial [Oryza sativa Japonica Group]